MNIKNLKVLGGVFGVVAVLGLGASAETFFGQGADNTKELVQDSKKFKEEVDKVNREKQEMLDGLQINRSAPVVENLNQKAPTIEIANLDGVDVDAIAQRYERSEKQIQAGERVYVFATLDMPKTTLIKLAEDVAKLDGALVLRGFYDGSLKKTYSRIGELGLKTGNIQINPEAFKKYKIDKAPTFVLAKKIGMYESLDLDGCVIPEQYIKISGDVSLDFALEKMQAMTDDDTEKGMLEKQLNRLG